MGIQSKLLTRGPSRQPSRSRKTRVMVVDDSLTARTILARLINTEPDLDVIAKASSAELALEELKKNPVDVVLLDLEMPGMGGLGALPKILAIQDGIQVLVVSSLTQDGAEHTLTALSMGAADTMPKPSSGEFGAVYLAALFAKIRALSPIEKARSGTMSPNTLPSKKIHRSPMAPEILAIGASTGGIHAICILLRNLPRQFNLPILITQHLPNSFMPVFARQLATASSRETLIAEDSMPIEGSRIFIAPGDGHLNLLRTSSGLVAKITHQATPSGCVPSVDPMFETAARATGGRALGVVLSGMGRDGVIGARALTKSGGTIFAQDQASSAVWGMPGAIAEEGIAAAVLPPIELAASIMASLGASAWK